MNFKIFFPLSLLLFLVFLKGESQTGNCLKTFQNKYGNNDDNTALNIVDAGNNQFYVAGNSVSNNSSDILITKHSADGSILWAKKYGAAGDETVRRIKLANDGGLLIIGQTKSFTNSNGDILCLKISATGQLIWSRKFGVGSTFGDLGMDIIQATDNSYVFTGILNVTGTLADMLIVRLDVNANILWSQRFDSEQGENGVGLLQKGDTLIVTSDIDNNVSDFNGLISKIKLSDGKPLVTKKIRPDSRNLYNSYVFKDNADGYWISGHTIDQTSYANMQQIFLHFDVNFKLIQTYKLDLKNNIYSNDYYTGFALRPDGFLACAGSASNPAGYFFYIKNDGSIKMAKKFSGATDRELYGLLNANGKIISVGKEKSSGKNNLFVIEFGDDGFVDEKCHPDTALLTVSNPSYSVTDLNWKTVNDQQFPDISALLTTTDATLTASSLCDACQVDLCNTSLNLQKQMAGVQIGDLDVSGDKITVEASFNRTAPYDNTVITEGDIVSKHKTPNDVNYLLRPNRAEITTTSGYHAAIADCDIDINKTYHVALVYDGASLKFYRNGFLMKEVPATGSLVLNDYTAIIGDIAWNPGYNNETMLGYINNVRIWNIARTQTQIKQYMNQALPNPTTQTGLVAYYTFDDLKNKQGNSNWDGTLLGNAIINTVNPTCASFVADSCQMAITPSFTTPDTVCINTPVKITNTTKGATNYYWNFCTADINKTPESLNLGNIDGALQLPVFMDVVQQNGNFYGLIVNNWPGQLVRLDFGNSMLNTPKAVVLGNFGGILQNNAEGIQVVKNEGKWYALIVGGYPAGNTIPFIMKVDFGADITNANPVALNWGNLGGMNYPIDLYVFKDGSNWYGFTTNSENNTITRFNFGSSFDNTPTALNLGNIGNLSYPDGIYAMNNNGKWNVFIANAQSNSITRLDFGSSLLNTPVATNMGNIGNVLDKPRDIYLMKFCGGITGFVTNGGDNNDMVRLQFSNDLTTAPSAVSLGNFGNFSLPHSLSTIFRVDADLYSFVPNAHNNTITRLKFPGCTNSNIPNSSAQNPPDVTYNTPGIYNINLSVDEGLPTQASYCRQVVVLPSPEKKPTLDTSFCKGDSIILKAESAIGTYTWNTGSTENSITVKDADTYWVDINYYGCKARDSIMTALKANPYVFLGNDTTICRQDSLLLDAGKDGIKYLWQDNSTTETYLAKRPGIYNVTITNQAGCQSKDSLKVSVPNSNIDFTYLQDICSPLTMKFYSSTTIDGSFEWNFGDGTINNSNLNSIKKYTEYGIYNVTLKVINSKGCIDSITKQINLKITKDNTAIVTGDTTICKGSSVKLKALDKLSYCWSPSYNISDINTSSPTVFPDTTTVYYLYALGEQKNLIVNGDFSQGNVGFSSSYSYASNNTVEGEYFVGVSPLSWNGGMSACTDHKGQTGNGNMLMVNGAPDTDVNVWTETITVSPNTNYAFSTWVQTISPLQNPAQLQFSINGKLIGNIFKANDANCIWSQFYEIWNSGSSTTAIISIVNKNSIRFGNDFALDDISFAPTSILQDSVKVEVAEKPVVNIGADTAICAHDSLLLNAGNMGASYLWQDGSTSATYFAKHKGWYDVKVTNVGGCTSIDSILINSLDAPVVNIKDTTICFGNTVQLNVQSPGNNIYQWQASPTLSAINIYNPVAAPLDTSTYFVVVADANNCKTKDSVTVAVVPKPTVIAMADTSFCYGSTFTLSATGANTNHYGWSPSQGLNDATLQNPSGTLLTNTITYTVTAYNDGCSVSDNVKLTSLPLPNLSLGYKDTTICVGGQVQLNASGNGNFVWSPAMAINDTTSAAPIVNPVTSTWYHVKITSANNCINNDSVFVAVNPKPVFAINPKQPSICIGDSVLITASGGDAYTWSPVTSVKNPYGASSVVYPSENTMYEVAITNNTCHVTESVFANVTVTTKPEIAITKSNDIDCFIGSAKLEATGGSKFLWSPSATLSNTYGYTTIARPTETTTYYVEVSKNGSCKATDSIQVKVIKDGAQNGYFVPTAFTPNSDMRNDCFGVKNWGVVTNFDFSVYNRWGERIFYTRNVSDCWNGMYKNTLQPPGAYVYQIRAKALCGDVYRKGTIVLIR